MKYLAEIGGMKILNITLLLICEVLLILSLTGCLTIWEGDPRWEIPIISKECDSFSGKYYAYDEENHAILTGKIGDRPNIKVDDKYSQLIEYHEYSREYSLKWYSEANKPQRIKVYRQYIVSVEKNGSIINVSLFNESSQPDILVRIKLDHPNVGCDRNGNLVMRSILLFNSGDFRPGSAFAKELSLSRLPNGQLQLMELERIWYGTMNKAPDEVRKKIYLFNPA
ncbi:hypothetical protein [Diaphorobacter aerolatus]|uniref:Uncharacterized protein n=1 Tax=Diaphorobacter aerolatus TaxID=1288495 RepID=A0A7H0GKF9_9BURK|nr:hypothetical protein [Diaphorobacter aerolatus]QNP48775.1 hypothetical protein H9K75_00560 [Diaphorobacter aerolatus]